MREIKFRAWDDEMSEMAYSDNHDDSNHWFSFEKSGLVCFGIDYDAIPATIDSPPENDIYEIKNIMQFTGLRDRDGNEIYESDLMMHPDWRVGTVLKVEWMDYGCWGLSAWDVVRTDVSLGYVIGNIYEHPHLLCNDSTTDSCDLPATASQIGLVTPSKDK